MGDELVVVHPKARRADEFKTTTQGLALNSSARAIWELCDGTRSLREITDILTARFAADREVLSREVLGTLANFSELELIWELTKAPAAPARTTFVVGTEDKPYFWWQTALFLESFSGKLPPNWQTLFVVCNNGEPISDELKRILGSYDTQFAQARNHARSHPLDAGSSAGSHHGGLNKIQALSVASSYVGDDDIVCLLDSDTFLYRDLNPDIMPKRCALPWNWHVDQEKFFSTIPANNGAGV